MIAVIAVNAVLAAFVLSGMLVLLMGAIRTSDTEAPVVVPATARRQARTRARRGARALVPTRPGA